MCKRPWRLATDRATLSQSGHEHVTLYLEPASGEESRRRPSYCQRTVRGAGSKVSCTQGTNGVVPRLAVRIILSSTPGSDWGVAQSGALRCVGNGQGSGDARTGRPLRGSHGWSTTSGFGAETFLFPRAARGFKVWDLSPRVADFRVGWETGFREKCLILTVDIRRVLSF